MKQDIWINQLEEYFSPAVNSIVKYALQDNEFLVKYAANSTEIQVIKDVSMDTPLMKDGTSIIEQKNTVSPLPWPTKYVKTSNKAQQLALAANIEQKKKLFKELVPEYLHDFDDILQKMDLTNYLLCGQASTIVLKQNQVLFQRNLRFIPYQKRMGSGQIIY